MKPPLRRAAIAGVLIGVAAAGAVLMLDPLFTRLGGSGPAPVRAIELKTYDWRLSRAARGMAAHQDIVLVEIDELSLRALEPQAGRWPWPRAVHAALVDYLSRGPARLIVYDVNFAEPDSRVGFRYGDDLLSRRDSDGVLTEAVRAAGNVLLLVDATATSGLAGRPPTRRVGLPLSVNETDLMVRSTVFLPFEPLAGVAAAFGHSLIALDGDGPLRHSVPLIRFGDQAVPSISLAAALQVLDVAPDALRLDHDRLWIGHRAMPLGFRAAPNAQENRFAWSLINFRGPARLDEEETGPYGTYSFVDLLAAEEQIRTGLEPEVDPARFRDKVVFVGVTASGLSDVFETPFARGRMPGVQVHAAALDDILSNRFMREAPVTMTVLTALLASLTVGVIAAAVPAWWSIAVWLTATILVGWAGTMSVAGGYWLHVSEPVLGASFALVGGMAEKYFVEGRDKRTIKRLFSRYVSQDVFRQLVADPARATLGGERRQMTVLFSDIRGFSTVSESAAPEQIVGMLNDYFTLMVDVVFRHGGTLDKFVGDMVMALFGAPLDDPRHAERAVDAALDMVQALEQFNMQRARDGHLPIDIGIGINTGNMIAGNIGSARIMSYTVIGDAVNLGARLESLNKDYGTRIIISNSTRQGLSSAYILEPLGNVIVKGRTKPVAIFEVRGRQAVTPMSGAGEVVSKPVPQEVSI